MLNWTPVMRQSAHSISNNSMMSPRASHRRHPTPSNAILASSPGSFSYISTKRQQNIRQISLKGQKCRGNLPGWRQYGVNMAYWWRILEKKEDKFSRELDFWSISILWSYYASRYASLVCARLFNCSLSKRYI